jgi:ribosomal-protein-alanine N-acetyltransferase
MNIKIRGAELADILAVKEIESRSHLSGWPADQYLRAITEPSYLLLVAEDASIIRAFILARVVYETGFESIEIMNIAVTPEMRRKQLGTRMINELINLTGFQQGTVDLEVRSQNTIGVNFYRRIGFSEVGIRKNYYVDPIDDAIMMSRPINK